MPNQPTTEMLIKSDLQYNHRIILSVFDQAAPPYYH